MLLWEQILSLKSRPHVKEVLLLKKQTEFMQVNVTLFFGKEAWGHFLEKRHGGIFWKRGMGAFFGKRHGAFMRAGGFIRINTEGKTMKYFFYLQSRILY